MKGTGNQQDYSMRIYDPRLGKFLSVDPIDKKYPYYSPYHFASNTPIRAVDQDGLEADVLEISRNRQKIREYERDLYAKDPEHAKDIISEKNKRAFLFVGGMLTGGSGKLFMMFTDAVLAYAFYETGKGIIKKDARSVNEGVKDATIAATGDMGDGCSGSYLVLC